MKNSKITSGASMHRRAKLYNGPEQKVHFSKPSVEVLYKTVSNKYLTYKITHTWKGTWNFEILHIEGSGEWGM